MKPCPSTLDDFLLKSHCPIATIDLGRGARLLVPNGLSFGALQAQTSGRFHDWFRDAPDRHHISGSRHALHLGVDLAFFVRRQRVHMLPMDLPVRSPLAGVVAASYRGGAAELEPGGLIVLHDGDSGARRDRVTPFTYLGDVREAKKPGDRVGEGEVIAHTIGQRHRGVERVVVHLGVGLSIPGHGLEFMDPGVLLARWTVRHPVFPGSTCTPEQLRETRPGAWVSPGRIRSECGGIPWNSSWRTRY